MSSHIFKKSVLTHSNARQVRLVVLLENCSVEFHKIKRRVSVN